MGLAGVTGFTGCADLPLLGDTSPPLRGVHERQRAIAGLAVGPDGAYVAEMPTGGETQLIGLSLETADTRWERSLLASGKEFEMWRRGEHLLAMNGQTLIVTEAGFSEQTWRRHGATSPVVTEDTVFLRSVRDVPYVEALRLATGGIVWSVQIGGDLPIPPTRAPRAIAGERIVISDTDRPLRARDRSDGSLLWKTETPYMIPVQATETAIYALSSAQRSEVTVHRVAPRDGASESRSTFDFRRLRLVLTEEHLIGLVQTEDTHRVVGMDQTSLEERWRVENLQTSPDWTTSAALFGKDDSDRLLEIDPITGEPRWIVALETSTIHDLAVTDSLIGVATPGSVRCFARQDGTHRWTASVSEADAEEPTPAITATQGVFVHASGPSVRVFSAED
jgi:outer membrane protein assembly factor BamB